MEKTLYEIQREFSKEEEITSLSDENVETSGKEQIAKAKSDNVATSADTITEQNITTSDDHNCDGTESASTSVFDDPIRKKPSLLKTQRFTIHFHGDSQESMGQWFRENRHPSF